MKLRAQFLFLLKCLTAISAAGILCSGKFPESKLAHRYLDGLRGIEIGGAAHNPFGLKTINIDYSAGCNIYQQEQIKMCGSYLNVDMVAPGDDLPFKNETVDFVISSHVIEHFYDPIKTLNEWLRVVKKGGYVFIIAPHKERTFDKDRPRTTLAELVERHEHPNPPIPDHHGHYSFWVTYDFIELCNYMGLNIIEERDKDDKAENGFTVIIQK